VGTALDGLDQLLRCHVDTTHLAVDADLHLCHVELHHRTVRTEPDILLRHRLTRLRSLHFAIFEPYSGEGFLVTVPMQEEPPLPSGGDPGYHSPGRPGPGWSRRRARGGDSRKGEHL
ncbi:MAG: hypothetical protein ACREAQ_07215, partial [Nitrososphaera sp.]